MINIYQKLAALLVLVANPLILSATAKSTESASKMSSQGPIHILALGYQPDGMLPFSVAIENADEVYSWTPLAIVVRKVEFDGKELPPFARGLAMNKFDPGVIAPTSNQVTYLSILSPLVSVQKYDAVTGEYEAYGYDIPPAFKSLIITYACRFPNGKLSQPYELRLTVE